jgi:uncharacterized membrane protein YcaP (DUF421 family)
MNMFKLNFAETFAPTMSAVAILVHAAMVYLGLCVLLWIIPKRQARKANISELLFVVIIGQIAADAVSRGAKSLTDFLLVLLTVMLLGYAVDWLASPSRRFGRLRQAKPVSLIRDGRIARHIKDSRRVRKTYLEGDGRVSVMRKASDAPGRHLTGFGEEHGEDEEAARRRRRRRAEQLLALAEGGGP